MALAKLESAFWRILPRHRPNLPSVVDQTTCPFRSEDIRLFPLTPERAIRIFDQLGPLGIYWAISDSLDQAGSTRDFPFIESRVELDNRTALWLNGTLAFSSEPRIEPYENGHGNKEKKTVYQASIKTKLGGLVVFTEPYQQILKPFRVRQPATFRSWGKDWENIEQNGFDPHQQEQTLLVYYNDHYEELHLIQAARFWRGSSPPPHFQFTAPIANVCFESHTPFNPEKTYELARVLHFVDLAKTPD